MKKKKSSGWLLIWVVLVVFVLLFTFSSLNLKNIEYGYNLQDLKKQVKQLEEEIDKLEAEKASLMSLPVIEKTVMNKLGYQYPEPHQIIKVFEKKK